MLVLQKSKGYRIAHLFLRNNGEEIGGGERAERHGANCSATNACSPILENLREILLAEVLSLIAGVDTTGRRERREIIEQEGETRRRRGRSGREVEEMGGEGTGTTQTKEEEGGKSSALKLQRQGLPQAHSAQAASAMLFSFYSSNS